MKRFNLLIIGDELLNGRRQDKHLQYSIDLLAERGLGLLRSFIIGDEPDLIVSTLHHLNNNDDIVFCFGGIGATPDDYTRQCAAQAFEVPLVIHEEGRKILQEKFGDQTYPHRINMVTFPQGARLIPNPYNNIPGFSYKQFHFVPGFPQMAKPMMQWVLDNEYQHLHLRDNLVRKTTRIFGKSEGQLIELMNELLEKFPQVKLSCLPRIDVDRPYVDLSVLTESNEIAQVYDFIIVELSRLKAEWESV